MQRVWGKLHRLRQLSAACRGPPALPRLSWPAHLCQQVCIRHIHQPLPGLLAAGKPAGSGAPSSVGHLQQRKAAPCRHACSPPPAKYQAPLCCRASAWGAPERHAQLLAHRGVDRDRVAQVHEGPRAEAHDGVGAQGRPGPGRAALHPHLQVGLGSRGHKARVKGREAAFVRLFLRRLGPRMLMEAARTHLEVVVEAGRQDCGMKGRVNAEAWAGWSQLGSRCPLPPPCTPAPPGGSSSRCGVFRGVDRCCDGADVGPQQFWSIVKQSSAKRCRALVAGQSVRVSWTTAAHLPGHTTCLPPAEIRGAKAGHGGKRVKNEHRWSVAGHPSSAAGCTAQKRAIAHHAENVLQGGGAVQDLCGFHHAAQHALVHLQGIWRFVKIAPRSQPGEAGA